MKFSKYLKYFKVWQKGSLSMRINLFLCSSICSHSILSIVEVANTTKLKSARCKARESLKKLKALSKIKG